MFGFKKKVETAKVAGNETKPFINGDAKKHDEAKLETARMRIEEGNYSEVKEMIGRNEVPKSIFKDVYLQFLATKGKEVSADWLANSGLLTPQEISETVEIAFRMCMALSQEMRYDKEFSEAMEQAELAMGISEKFKLNSTSYVEAQELYSKAEHYYRGGV